jgi:hypothetical protein
MPTLPTIDDPQVQHMSNEDAKAYHVCLTYEKEYATIASKLRCVRILGFLLLNAPNQDVRIEVTKSILSCGDGGELVDLGSFLERNVILPCELLVLCLPLSLIYSVLSSYEVRSPNADF